MRPSCRHYREHSTGPQLLVPVIGLILRTALPEESFFLRAPFPLGLIPWGVGVSAVSNITSATFSRQTPGLCFLSFIRARSTSGISFRSRPLRTCYHPNFQDGRHRFGSGVWRGRTESGRELASAPRPCEFFEQDVLLVSAAIVFGRLKSSPGEQLPVTTTIASRTSTSFRIPAFG